MKKEDKNYTAGIDIGASKVTCVIGEKTKDGLYNIYGSGFIKHNSFKRGVPADIRGLTDAIGKAVYKAEEDAGFKVRSAYVNFTDPSIDAVLSHSEAMIADRDSEITRFDAEKVVKNAQSISLPYERDIFYTQNHGYTLDGEKGILNPAGMYGFKLGVDLYIVTVKATSVENIKKGLRQNGISASEIILSAVASFQSLTSEHERQIGTILVDMGADLTEICIYVDGILKFLKIIPFGGDNITQSLSRCFRIPHSMAEYIKTENSSIDEDYAEDEKIIFDVESRRRVIYKKELKTLLQKEYSAWIAQIKEALEKSDVYRDASNGLLLSGAAAFGQGVAEKVEMELGCPVKVGHITEIGLCPNHFNSNIFATAAGLLKYGIKKQESRMGFVNKSAKNIISSIANYARSLYREYF